MYAQKSVGVRLLLRSSPCAVSCQSSIFLPSIGFGASCNAGSALRGSHLPPAAANSHGQVAMMQVFLKVFLDFLAVFGSTKNLLMDLNNIFELFT
ncbi:MAG: hypothetical protein Q4F57_05595 [Weeksellaceae bacterium]|nr:hypothetical protein [Weeksellaceae bacterium]